MASRIVIANGNQDMSSFGSVPGGNQIGDLVSISFDTNGSIFTRQSALKKLVEKLAEEGWI